jgi:hypothetical protein
MPRGRDRVEALFSRLAPFLPAPICGLYQSGDLAVGGVAVPGVLAHTYPLGGTWAIEMSSAFMRFLYAVCRTQCGNARVVANPGNVVPAAITLAELVDHMTAIVTAWKSGAVWDRRPCAYPEFPLHPSQVALAEEVTCRAELFILAHEVGHVMAAHSPGECSFPKDVGPEVGEELWADAFATRAVVTADQGQPRYAYAGAVLAVRVCAWLERMGFDFGPDYPTAERRLAQVRDLCKSLLPPQDFAFISTIAQAFDDQLEAVEARVLGAPVTRVESADRVQIRLLAVAEERARGRLGPEEYLRAASAMVRSVPEPILVAVAGRLFREYVSPIFAAGESKGDIRAGVRAELLALAPKLPEPARAVFASAFGGAAGVS